jgi:hypothetical protein
MKKSTIRNTIFTLLLCLLLTKCADFFQEDLSCAIPSIVTPTDSMVVAGPTITFWWESVAFSEGYDFQLVRPDFQRPVELITDTVLCKNSISLIVTPGVYQWRVRAFNQSSVTAFREQTLFVSEN